LSGSQLLACNPRGEAARRLGEPICVEHRPHVLAASRRATLHQRARTETCAQPAGRERHTSRLVICSVALLASGSACQDCHPAWGEEFTPLPQARVADVSGSWCRVSDTPENERLLAIKLSQVIKLGRAMRGLSSSVKGRRGTSQDLAVAKPCLKMRFTVSNPDPQAEVDACKSTNSMKSTVPKVRPTACTLCFLPLTRKFSAEDRPSSLFLFLIEYIRPQPAPHQRTPFPRVP
jgi:hypothetical protein